MTPNWSRGLPDVIDAINVVAPNRPVKKITGNRFMIFDFRFLIFDWHLDVVLQPPMLWAVESKIKNLKSKKRR
jgi:hypothetical protein